MTSINHEKIDYLKRTIKMVRLKNNYMQQNNNHNLRTSTLNNIKEPLESKDGFNWRDIYSNISTDHPSEYQP